MSGCHGLYEHQRYYPFGMELVLQRAEKYSPVLKRKKRKGIKQVVIILYILVGSPLVTSASGLQPIGVSELGFPLVCSIYNYLYFTCFTYQSISCFSRYLLDQFAALLYPLEFHKNQAKYGGLAASESDLSYLPLFRKRTTFNYFLA
jgi:hypothetical protein